MNYTNILLAIIGFLVPVVGWVVSTKLDKQKINSLQKEAQAREYFDDQLHNLHGPIFLLQRESKAHFVALLNKFQRNVLIPTEGLSELEIEIYNQYVMEYFIPINRKIIDIIQNNAHLLPGEEYPDSYKNFIDYACTWESTVKVNEKVKEYLYIPPPYNYPVDFENEIIKSMEILKKRQKCIIDKYSR